MQFESALFCHIFNVQRLEGPDDEAITSKDCSQLGYPNFLILDSNEDSYVSLFNKWDNNAWLGLTNYNFGLDIIIYFT